MVLVLMGKLRQGAAWAAAAPLAVERAVPRTRGSQGGGAARSSSSSSKGGWSRSCHLPGGEGPGRLRAGEAGGGGAGEEPHFLCFSSLSLLLALLSVWLLGLLLRYILSMALRASVR